MKKRILSCFITVVCLTFASKSFGQFTVSADATNDTISKISSAVVTIYDTITNTHNDTISINWHVNLGSSSLPAGWTASPCDNFQCYGYDGTTHTSKKMPSGATGMWYVEIDPTGGGLGTGWVSENLTDNFGTTTKTIVSMLTKTATSGISVIHTEDDVIIYPNPAKNDINVLFNESLGVRTIGVYNLIGKSVSLFRTTGNTAKLNIENLPSGIYFIRLMDSNSNVITTRKFTRL